MSHPKSPAGLTECIEQKRLNDARETGVPWKKWGPYLSERQWGTVREDYSPDGNAWDYFTHDQSRSRTYRWGEDGIGGISDDKQRLCFALALWNGKDPILKERLFGLTNSEGNHGEDVKEYYFYVDSTPTHSYMKSLYKYPQGEFPYRDLIETNRRTVARGDGVRAARHRRVRRGPVLRRLRRVRQGRSGGRPHPHHGPQPRPRGGAPPPPADALVPEHVVLGRGRDEAAPRATSGPGRIRAAHPELGTYTLACDGSSRAPLHGERDERRASLGAAEPLSVREGRVPPVRRAAARRGAVNPGEVRHEGRGPVRSRRAGRGLRGRPAPPRRRAADAGLRQGVRRDLRRASRRRGRVLRADHAALAHRGRAARPPAGARRDALVASSSTSSTSTAGSGARRAPAPREPHGAAERRLVPHVQRRRHLDARQVGVPVVRGLGPRVPHAVSLPRRLRLRQAAAPPDAPEPLRAPERADPGVRVELQRREPAGPRVGDALPLPVRARASGGRTASSSSAPSRGCSSTSTGG